MYVVVRLWLVGSINVKITFNKVTSIHVPVWILCTHNYFMPPLLLRFVLDGCFL